MTLLVHPFVHGLSTAETKNEEEDEEDRRREEEERRRSRQDGAEEKIFWFKNDFIFYFNKRE